jgi:hypothetical protein
MSREAGGILSYAGLPLKRDVFTQKASLLDQEFRTLPGKVGCRLHYWLTWLQGRGSRSGDLPVADVDGIRQAVDDLHELLSGGRSGIDPSEGEGGLWGLAVWQQSRAALRPIHLQKLLLTGRNLLLDQLTARTASYC